MESSRLMFLRARDATSADVGSTHPAGLTARVPSTTVDIEDISERSLYEWSAGLSQAEAIDPSVTSPLCAAKAARTSSFSRGGTPK